MRIKFSEIKIGERFTFPNWGTFEKVNRSKARFVHSGPNMEDYKKFNKDDVVTVDRTPKIREIWICPHEYSCGGYYLAERFSENEFWLLSGRMEVLTKYQAELRLGYCRERGEIINEVWANSLPEGSKWLNL